MNRVMNISSCLLSSFILLPGLLFGQSRLNGNVLSLASGGTISVGSQLRINHPAKGSRYSFIYSELSLRASSEDDLPYGIPGTTAGEEVTVKRFLERKGSRGSKYYVICRGSFINNAIDIDNAIKAGEVQYNGSQNASSSASNGGVMLKPVQGEASNQRSTGDATLHQGTGVAGGIVNGGIAAGHVMRRPWDNTAMVPVKKDTASARDSSQRFAKAFKAVDSSARQIPVSAGIVKPDTASKTVHLSAREAADTRLPEKKAEAVIVPAVITPAVSSAKEVKLETPVQGRIVETPKAESLPVKVEPDAAEVPAHSVSNLMVLPTAESLKPKDVPVATVKPENPTGYTKFSKLKQLKELLDAGVLTKAEFDIEKKKILASEQ